MDRGRMLEVIRAEGFAFPDESLIRLCNRMVVEGAMVDQAEKFFRDADLARIRELEAKYEEAEACARCEHEKRLGIEQQRDELLAALRPVAERGEISAAIINQARAAIAKVEG